MHAEVGEQLLLGEGRQVDAGRDVDQLVGPEGDADPRQQLGLVGDTRVQLDDDAVGGFQIDSFQDVCQRASCPASLGWRAFSAPAQQRAGRCQVLWRDQQVYVPPIS